MDTQSKSLNNEIVLENPNLHSQLWYFLVDKFGLDIQEDDELLLIKIKLKLKENKQCQEN